MSHFSVLVIGDDIETQLQPYHEFECTGINDQYVVDVDKTAEARKEYESSQGYASFRAFLEGWYGANKVIGPGQEPDREGEHKYGFVQVDASGEAIQYIDRTNPNRKWDWWVVGGRWSGFFLLKTDSEDAPVLGRPGTFGRGHRVDARTTDQAKKSEIDWEMMAARARQEAEASYQEFLTKDGGNPRSAWIYDIKYRPEVEATWQAMFADDKRPTDAQRAAWNRDRTLDDLEDCEAYVHRRAAHSGVTYALVKNGQWFERGKMGWFGMAADEQDESVWNPRYWELIESLPDDTLLTVVDCHI